MAEKKSTMSLLSLLSLSVVVEADPFVVVDWLGCDDDAAELGVSAIKSGINLNPAH
jgi:hypothetical protein